MQNLMVAAVVVKAAAAAAAVGVGAGIVRVVEVIVAAQAVNQHH